MRQVHAGSRHDRVAPGRGRGGGGAACCGRRHQRRVRQLLQVAQPDPTCQAQHECGREHCLQRLRFARAKRSGQVVDAAPELHEHELGMGAQGAEGGTAGHVAALGYCGIERVAVARGALRRRALQLALRGEQRVNADARRRPCVRPGQRQRGGIGQAAKHMAVGVMNVQSRRFDAALLGRLVDRATVVPHHLQAEELGEQRVKAQRLVGDQLRLRGHAGAVGTEQHRVERRREAAQHDPEAFGAVLALLGG